jgi:hypothetical protein
MAFRSKLRNVKVSDVGAKVKDEVFWTDPVHLTESGYKLVVIENCFNDLMASVPVPVTNRPIMALGSGYRYRLEWAVPGNGMQEGIQA